MTAPPIAVDPVQVVSALVLVGLASAALGVAVAAARALRERLGVQKTRRSVPAAR